MAIYPFQPSESDQKGSFTGFDPFAQIVESPDTISPSDPFGGNDPFQQQQTTNGSGGKTGPGLIDLDLGANNDDFDLLTAQVQEKRDVINYQNVEDDNVNNVAATGDLLGGSVTSPEFEGPEGSYDLLRGHATTTSNDLIEEEEEEEDEDDEEEEENSVVEKDDLPEKEIAKDNDSMAELSENERRGYESQFDDLMGGMGSGDVATNGHQEYYTDHRHEEEEEDEEQQVVTSQATFTMETSRPYSPPSSPEVRYLFIDNYKLLIKIRI